MVLVVLKRAVGGMLQPVFSPFVAFICRMMSGTGTSMRVVNTLCDHHLIRNSLVPLTAIALRMVGAGVVHAAG